MRAALFDLDGTLLDTLSDIALPLNETLAAFGFPACPLERVRKAVGNGAFKLVERVVPEGGNVTEVYEAFRKRYGASRHLHTRPFEGVPALLSRLKEEGVQLAVLTNKPQEATVSAVEKFFPGMFGFVQGDSGDFPPKPDPTAARYCALTLRVPLKECVVIGDGETDALLAKRAGMRGVSVLWGYRTEEELKNAGAETFARTPEELGKILGNF